MVTRGFRAPKEGDVEGCRLCWRRHGSGHWMAGEEGCGRLDGGAGGGGEEGRRGGLWWERLGQPAALASASWRAALGRSRPPVGSGGHSSHGRAWRESPQGRGQAWRGLRKEPARQPGRAASYPEVLSQEGRRKAVARLRQQVIDRRGSGARSGAALLGHPHTTPLTGPHCSGGPGLSLRRV